MANDAILESISNYVSVDIQYYIRQMHFPFKNSWVLWTSCTISVLLLRPTVSTVSLFHQTTHKSAHINVTYIHGFHKITQFNSV